jgi:hypothetical protein
MAKERDPEQRVHRGEYDGVLDDVRQSERDQREKPHDHDRTEHRTDTARSTTLDEEQTDQNRDGNRHDKRFEDMRRDAETFNRAQHRNRRRNHAVAVQQRRAKQPDHHEHRMGDLAFERTSTSARIPPSPPLSARMTNSRYLIETVMISDQKIRRRRQGRWRC